MGQTGDWTLTATPGSTFVELRTLVGARGLVASSASGGSAANNWARFEITANVTGSGTWLSRVSSTGGVTGASPCASGGNTSEAALKVAGSFPSDGRDFAGTFRNASGAVIVPPSVVGGGSQTYRIRITRTRSGDDLSYATVALPTCLSNVAIAGTTNNPSGGPDFVASLSDNVIRFPTSGDKLAANGQWTQVEFTATAGCAGEQPFRFAAWKNTSPESAQDDVFRRVPAISIGDVKLTEGTAGPTAFTFTVTLSSPHTSTVTVNAASVNGTATTAGLDYLPLPSTPITFLAGETAKTVTVNVIGDLNIEPDETFLVNLTNAVNGFIDDSQAVGTILNDDNSITINDVTLDEGDSGQTDFTFTVTLSPAHTAPVTVQYATANGTATTGDSDYVAHATTTLTFTAGQTSKLVTVKVNGDPTDEPDETFFVNLTNATNATITDSQGIGTIVNDENDPPTCTNPQSGNVDEDDELNGSVICTDPDLDTLAYSLVGDVGNGDLTFNSNGTFSYEPDPNYNGSDSFTFKANDGTVDSNTATFNITVNPVNDAPVNTVPGGQTTNEDTSLVFSTANGNLIGVSDVDAAPGSVQVTLDVDHGTLTLGSTMGLNFTAGDGTGDAQVTFSGSLTSVNLALSGLGYAPTANYHGPDQLMIATDDLGNTGAGGAQTDTDIVTITVNSVNDAPSGADDTISIDEDGSHTFAATDFGFSDANDTPADGSPR